MVVLANIGAADVALRLHICHYADQRGTSLVCFVQPAGKTCLEFKLSRRHHQTRCLVWWYYNPPRKHDHPASVIRTLQMWVFGSIYSCCQAIAMWWCYYSVWTMMRTKGTIWLQLSFISPYKTLQMISANKLLVQEAYNAVNKIGSVDSPQYREVEPACHISLGNRISSLNHSVESTKVLCSIYQVVSKSWPFNTIQDFLPRRIHGNWRCEFINVSYLRESAPTIGPGPQIPSLQVWIHCYHFK